MLASSGRNFNARRLPASARQSPTPCNDNCMALQGTPSLVTCMSSEDPANGGVLGRCLAFVAWMHPVLSLRIERAGKPPGTTMSMGC
jgi:hypothetical protein